MENNKNKTFEDATNNKQKLKNAVSSVDAKEHNLDQNHSKKPEAMGPNTKR